MRITLLAAAWFGLLTGLVEGSLLWGLRQAGWLRGPLAFLGSSLDILWISALFDLVLFAVVGLVACLALQLAPRLPAAQLGVLVFGSMAFFAWLAIPLMGRVRIWAIPLPALGLAVQSMRWSAVRQRTMSTLWRRGIPWLAAGTIAALVGTRGGAWLKERIVAARLPAARAGAPNILVIVVDALRADHVSSYGYARETSPNVDRMAKEGVMFENAFSTSSWTPPSHASMLTGRYTHEHGADAYRPLDDRFPSIGESLQASGYRTAAFSANYRNFCAALGFGRGFSRFEDQYRSVANAVTNTLFGRVTEEYVLHRILGLKYRLDRKRAVDVNVALLRWLRRDQSRPFFAFLNYYDAHDPYVPPESYRSMFSEFASPGGLVNSEWDARHGIYSPMTPEQLQGEIDAYDGAIAYVDEYTGQLLRELRRRGWADNTIVVVTSDHGESFGEHGLLHHANSLYLEVIHVPLVIWWPGHIPSGERVALPVTNAALPATLLDLAGVEASAPFPGSSLAGLWREADPARNRLPVLAEVDQLDWAPEQHLPAHGAMRALITEDWQYIEHDVFGSELYRWRVDPDEETDLFEDPEWASTVQDLQSQIGALLEGQGDQVAGP